MQIIPIHYKVSEPVIAWEQIREQAGDLVTYMEKADFFTEPMALSHCQVSENPFAFFVVNKYFIDNGMFRHQIIVNPRIIGAHRDLVQTEEGCMSFPHRKPRNMMRWPVVSVEYQTPSLSIPECFTSQRCALVAFEEEVKDIVAQLFQHETQHASGKNIYFEKP